MLVELLSVILRVGESAVFDDPCAGATARSRQDPHLDLAHGGSADFRGTDQGLYNYLSTPGLSVNARFEEALYTLHDGLLLVNGTFMTEVHVAALVAGDAVCKWAYVSYHASELNQQNWGWRAVKTSCGGSEVTLGPNRNRTCGGLITSVSVGVAHGGGRAATRGVASARRGGLEEGRPELDFIHFIASSRPSVGFCEVDLVPLVVLPGEVWFLIRPCHRGANRSISFVLARHWGRTRALMIHTAH